MRINSIQSTNQPAFNGFRATSNGVVRLANDFVKNPELEKQFVEHIVKPLKNTNTDVLFDGYSTHYKTLDGGYSTIIQAYKNSNEVIVKPASGPNKWSRSIFRPKGDTPLEPVTEFESYPYKEFEAAKNIAKNIELDAGKNNMNLSEKMKSFFFPSDHPLAKKFQEIIEYLS